MAGTFDRYRFVIHSDVPISVPMRAIGALHVMVLIESSIALFFPHWTTDNAQH